jgi:hypothetical protein
MDDDARRSAFLTALTTEHFVLQTAANATYADAAARSSLYVFSLSSSLIAMGFISQSPDLMPVFVAIVLPALFVIGTLTFVRLVDSALENNQYLIGIARIRRHYRSLSPDAETLFASRRGRWPEGPEPSLALGTFIAFLGTTATMIAFINSVVAGVGVAVLVDSLVGREMSVLSAAIGVVAIAILIALFLAFQRWRFAAFAADLESPDEAAGIRG